MLFDIWLPLWAYGKRRMGLIDAERQEFLELFDAFEPVEGEYRDG